MHTSQATIRELYEAILDHRGPGLRRDLLGPWLEREHELRGWLADFRQRRGSPIPAASAEDLWRLYALSRANDALLRDATARAERRWFLEQLGLEPIRSAPFSPFFHEIVRVEPSANPEEPITIVGEPLWTGFMLGTMLFARAGVVVRAGRAHAVKEIAERSTLYWAFTRPHRRTADLSMGWGSNSQWRTSFRRDYLVGETAHYNVDGRPRAAHMHEDGFTRPEIDELVRHRCFIRCERPDGDLFPYEEQSTGPLHPPA